MDEVKSAPPEPPRSFRTPEEAMSGKGAVRSGRENLERWPYSLGDYLKSFVGMPVRVGCVLPNGRYFEKTGELATVGTNFIALRSMGTGDLVLLDLSAVKGVTVSETPRPPR